LSYEVKHEEKWFGFQTWIFQKPPKKLHFMEDNHEDGAIDLDATPTMMEIMPEDDGDHVRALEMKIKGARQRGHIISHMNCM
jgi:hypothetical protein